MTERQRKRRGRKHQAREQERLYGDTEEGRSPRAIKKIRTLQRKLRGKS